MTFIVALDDLRQTKFIATPLEQLETGEVLLKIDRFALTANNITYAELNNPSRAKPRCCAFECPLTGEMGGIHERRFLAVMHSYP